MTTDMPPQKASGEPFAEEKRPYDARDNYESPTYLRPQPKTFPVRVHINNEKYEPGKKIMVRCNKIKTFEHFLEECTEIVRPPFGAARRLYTARGRHRISKIEDLEEDSIYVVTGNEHFKKHNTDPLRKLILPYSYISPAAQLQV